jgi:GNAT superfamily N-acetyltransferase
MLYLDNFLSNHLKKKCFNTDNLISIEKFLEKKIKRDFLITYKTKKRISLEIAKKYNLNFISTLFVLRNRSLKNKKIKSDKNLIFKKAVKNDWNKVKKILSKSGTSRIFYDKKIKKSLRETYLKKWIHNFFLGKRGNNLIICEDKKRNVLGFILLINKKNYVVYDQVFVSRLSRGKGIGSKLMTTVNKKFCRGLPIVVGTHSLNTKAISMYKKCGYKLIKKYHYYHLHT